MSFSVSASSRQGTFLGASASNGWNAKIIMTSAVAEAGQAGEAALLAELLRRRRNDAFVFWGEQT